MCSYYQPAAYNLGEDPALWEEWNWEEWEAGEVALWVEPISDQAYGPVAWWRNGFFLVGVALGIMVLLALALPRPQAATASEGTKEAPGNGGVSLPEAATAVVAPYAEYAITQGLHGQSYGHLAVDLAAGAGTAILSPIQGTVTALYVDEFGNTTLVLENEIYAVMMLHGDYTVAVGDEVGLGMVVGTEGNHGYTMDKWGNLCYGRDGCGFHTHLNVYDKRIQANVNPLDLIQ